MSIIMLKRRIVLTSRAHHSSQIAQVLGYADSEYVVENITIRVPP